MSENRTRRAIAALALSGIAVLATACGTTVNDDGDGANDPGETESTGGDGSEISADDTTPLDGVTVVDSQVPETTAPIAGTAAELLPRIGIEMSRLSSEIGDDGDEDATIARIEADWAAIRDEIEQTRPELVDGIQATIDMARTAVDANRPADADKAFSLLTDLVDAFTGDS